MPKGYKELPTTENYQQFSAPAKLRSVLTHDKQVPVQESMAFQYAVDTFQRTSGAHDSPAIFADLRASDRGRKLRADISGWNTLTQAARVPRPKLGSFLSRV